MIEIIIEIGGQKMVDKTDRNIFFQVSPDQVAAEIDFLNEKRLGLQLMLMDTRWLWRYEDSQAEDISSKVKDAGIPITIHGPFLDLNPGSDDEAIRSYTRKCYLRTIKLNQLLGSDRIILHSGLNPLLPRSSILKWLERSVEVFRALLEETGGEAVTLVIENSHDPIPEVLLSLVDKIGSEMIKVCFDIGHVNVFSTKTLKDWMDKLKDLIVEVHLHDNHGDSDDHLALGEGSIDIGGVLSELDKMGISVDMTLEMNRTRASQSLDYLGKLDVTATEEQEISRPKLVVTEGGGMW